MAAPRILSRFTSPFTSNTFRTIGRAGRRPAQSRTNGRRYASNGSGIASTLAGDLPWAIGSITVTVPACYYLIANAPEPIGDHDHSHGDEEHKAGEHGEEEHAEGEESADDSTEQSGQASEEGEPDPNTNEGETASAEGEQGPDEHQEASAPEDSQSEGGEGSSEEETPETSEDEDSRDTARVVDSGSKVEGVQFKGATREGGKGDTRKHIPDAKGGAKKRIESDQGNRQGVISDETAKKYEDSPIDAPAASKTPGGQFSQSGRQAGLSNTDTKHPMIDSSEKSTKGEGAPETAKLQGTVDPRRPQK